MNKAVRFALALVAGYILGTLIGVALFFSCADAQMRVNERVVLTTANSTVLRGAISEASISSLMADLQSLIRQRGTKPYIIYVVLDSPGGEVDAGLSFIEFAKTLPNVKTISIFAASMASAIAEALPGQRLVTANGTMMFHRAAGQFKGHFEHGEVESELGIAKAMVIAMEKITSARMGLSLTDYKALAHDELWLYGDDAVTSKAADKVIDIVCSDALIKKVYTAAYVMSFFGGDDSVSFSGCPLFRSAVGGVAAGKYSAPTAENFDTITKPLQSPTCKVGRK